MTVTIFGAETAVFQGFRKVMASALLTTTALGAGAFVAPATAYAQEARSYDIPAGPLAVALNRFGEAADVELVYDSVLTNGASSPGLKGSFGTAEALSRLLAGTGLTFRQNGPRAFTLERAPQSAGAVIQLGPVRVEGGAEAVSLTSDAAATEGTGSYTAKTMSTATKLRLTARETPQSVSVVTRTRMDDGGMITVEDAMTNTTGISVMATGGERSGYVSRGFSVDNIMVDGLTISHDSDTIGSATLAMYDRVEVVRGATGLLEGAGNPSASINLVRKRPTSDFQASIIGAAGSWNNYLGTIDVGGPIIANGAIRARLVASYQDSDTFTQDYSHKRRLLYGIIEADLTPSTLLTVGGYFNREKNPGADWNGLPTRTDGSFFDFDRSVRSSPSWTYWNKKNVGAFGELHQRLGGDWEASIKANYLDSSMDMIGASLYRTDDTDLLTYNVGKYHYSHRQTTLDASVLGSFQFLGRTHQLSFGVNYRRYINDDGPGGGADAFDYKFDPLNWQQSIIVPKPTFTPAWQRNSKEVNYGAYTTAKFNVADGLNIFAGGRVSWYDLTSGFRYGTYSETTAYDAKARLTPYGAVTYDILHNVTAYASVTSIFKPQSSQGPSGGLLAPVTGTNYEAGIKGDFFDGRVTASAAVFDIEQRNLPDQLPVTQCLTVTDCYSAAGKVRSRGFEIETSGQITRNLRVFAGYSFTDAKYVEDSTNGSAGDRYAQNQPRHILTFSTVYTLPFDNARWRVGASGRAQSAIEGNVSGYVNARQGSYATFDFSAGYQPTNNFDIRLNLYNAFDRYYYKSVSYTDNANILGAPRSFLVTGTYKF